MMAEKAARGGVGGERTVKEWLLREPHLYLDLDVDRWPTDLTDRVGRPEREASMEEEAFRAIGIRFCLSTT